MLTSAIEAGDVAAVTQGMEKLTVVPSKYSAGKHFDRFASHLSGRIAQFAVSNFDEFLKFTLLCKRFKELSEFAFIGNSPLLEDLCKRRKKENPRDILDGIGEPILGYVKKHAHTITSLRYPHKACEMLTKAKMDAFVQIFSNISSLTFEPISYKKIRSECSFPERESLEPLAKISLRELHIRTEEAPYLKLFLLMRQFQVIGKILKLEKLTFYQHPYDQHDDEDPQFNFEDLNSLNLQVLEIRGAKIDDSKKLACIAKASLTALSLCNCNRIRDEGLFSLKEAQNLQRLDLTDCRTVTDKGLASIGHLRLTHLKLDRTRVSDISALINAEQLVELGLESTPISDIGLTALQNAVNLTKLNLTSCGGIDGSCLQHLISPKHKLLVLFLSRTSITQLAPINTLQNLHFSLTPLANTITDLYLQNVIAKFSDLEMLFFDSGEITDDGLQCLASLKKLQVLYTCRTKHITKAGIDRLTKALPDLACEIGGLINSS